MTRPRTPMGVLGPRGDGSHALSTTGSALAETGDDEAVHASTAPFSG